MDRRQKGVQGESLFSLWVAFVCVCVIGRGTSWFRGRFHSSVDADRIHLVLARGSECKVAIADKRDALAL